MTIEQHKRDAATCGNGCANQECGLVPGIELNREQAWRNHQEGHAEDNHSEEEPYEGKSDQSLQAGVELSMLDVSLSE